MGDTIKTSEVINKLKENGCYFVEHGGDHDRWYSPITKRKVSVPRHSKTKRSTAILIYKQAGIK